MTQVETILEVETAGKKWNQGHQAVLSDAIWNDDLQVGTAENMLMVRTLNGTFWYNLNRCFEVETAEIILKPRWINGACWRNLKRWLWSLEVLWKKIKTRTLNGAILRCLRRCLELHKEKYQLYFTCQYSKVWKQER